MTHLPCLKYNTFKIYNIDSTFVIAIVYDARQLFFPSHLHPDFSLYHSFSHSMSGTTVSFSLDLIIMYFFYHIHFLEL